MKATTLFASGFVLLTLAACKEKETTPPQGLVADATTPATVEAGPIGSPTDPSQCGGCQLSPAAQWTFEGIYRDEKCTEPLAQLVTPACAQVPALGSTSITFVDEVAPRKAGSSATVTMKEQIGPAANRYRKAGNVCVKANEGAVDLTPINCSGQRICRDATGALACASCRTFANGCADYEESRMYAAFDDPDKKKPAGGGGDSLARLRQCCAAIAAEAARQGNAPELLSAAASCNMLVAAAGPNGNAPELAAVRSMLGGRQLPAVCAGL